MQPTQDLVQVKLQPPEHSTRSELQPFIQQLKERLEQRKIIEQAKWILVKRKKIEEPEAMKLLQKQARNNRKTLVEVAAAIVESDDLLGD